MAASASNTTTVQYPIWIDRDNMYCDEANFKNHLAQKLNYSKNDANIIIQQINGYIERNLPNYFWRSAAEKMNTEAIRVLLQTLEHSQLIYMLRYQDEYEHTALHWCALNRNNEMINVILDSVSEEECYQLLSITNEWRLTALHLSCREGDTESVRLMLNHINQDMRYSLLQMTNNDGDTALIYASYNGHTDVMKEIHESVTQTQWINLLHMKGEMTVLQAAVYWNEQSSIKAIRDSVSDEEWMQIVSTPLPEYYEAMYFNEGFYKQAVNRIDELRAAARVKSVLQTKNNSGMLSVVQGLPMIYSTITLQ